MSSQRLAWIWAGAAALGAGVLSGSCARPGAPSGGPVDFIPPMIESTWPDTFAVIEPTREPVRIVFNERISERPTEGRSLDDAVLVSPMTGPHEVKHTRSGLEIEVLGGFQPDLVYRVRILPTVKDLFNNSMEGPFELVFSTGAPFETNVLAGMVKDRITGEEVGGVRVEARPLEISDPPVYTASTDSAGVFALRYLPAGAYELSLFEDVNRNSEADFRELQGFTEAGPLGMEPGVSDTVIIREVNLLRPDTTPAELIRVEAMDSLFVRVAFDDFLDAEGSLDSVQVRIGFEEGPYLAVERLMWPRQRDSLQAVADSIAAEEQRLATLDSLQVVADSLTRFLATLEAAGDTLGVDTVGAVLEQIQARLEPPEPEEELEEERGPGPSPPILPKQEFYARMADTLPPDQLLQATVTGVVNLHGLPGGGGEASFAWEPPEQEPQELPDTASVPDTAAAPDTATAPDTVAMPPDTTRTAPPDTIRTAPSDTTRTAPPNASSPLRPSRVRLPLELRREPLRWIGRREP